MQRLAIDCVIPAAGLSSRMGSHKLLEEFGDHVLVYWAVYHALAACHRVIVVLGHNADEVRTFLPPNDGLTVVMNTEYERGMLTSIARGAAEVESDRFFVAPADMPFLGADLYRTIAAAADSPAADSEREPNTASKPMAWFPNHRGRSGHPVLINSLVLPALRTTVTDRNRTGVQLGPMHEFLAGYSTVSVQVDDDGSIVDIDTMAALQLHTGRARELES